MTLSSQSLSRKLKLGSGPFSGLSSANLGTYSGIPLPAQHPPAEGACGQPPWETQAGLQPGGEGRQPTGQLGSVGGREAGMKAGWVGTWVESYCLSTTAPLGGGGSPFSPDIL